jgi:hypothetical protein
LPYISQSGGVSVDREMKLWNCIIKRFALFGKGGKPGPTVYKVHAWSWFKKSRDITVKVETLSMMEFSK